MIKKLKKVKKIRNVVASSLAVLTVFSLNNVASAKWTQGYDGVSSYYTTAKCVYGDRAGAQYVQKLHDGLVGNNVADNGVIYTDNYAWESDFGTFADSKQFFAFAGHGLGYWAFSNGSGAASHFYTLNSSSKYHVTETDGAANAQWDEIRWGDGSMRWATMYQCNFLRNGGQSTNETKIWNMFQGLHLMMGFASIMYLDSREAGWYAARIGAGWTIKDSYFDAASQYQPQLPYSSTDPDGKVIARVKGYSTKGNDKWDSSTTAAPSYSSTNASSFSTWDRVITINP